MRNIQNKNKNGVYSRGPQLIPIQIDKVDISTAFRRSIQIIKDSGGAVMDGVGVVIEYLQSLPNMTANPTLNRTTIKEALPTPLTGSPEMQPWSGAF